MKRHRYTLKHAGWLTDRVAEFALPGDVLNVSVGAFESDAFYVLYCDDSHSAKRAARDICSAYAHEFGECWCFDCSLVVCEPGPCRALGGGR